MDHLIESLCGSLNQRVIQVTVITVYLLSSVV